MSGADDREDALLAPGDRIQGPRAAAGDRIQDGPGRARAAAGAGTVWYDPEIGAWRARHARSVDPARTRVKETFASEEAARIFLAQVATVAREPEARGEAGRTFYEVVDHVVTADERRGERGVRQARSLANWLGRHPVGSLPLGAITEEHLRDLAAEFLELVEGEEIAEQTARNRFFFVSGHLRRAVERRALPYSPAAGVELAFPRQRARQLYASVAELVAFCAHPGIPQKAKMVTLLYVGTGLRRRELLLAPRRNLRLEAGELAVEIGSRVLLPSGGERIHTPKSGKLRVVPLFGVALLAAEAMALTWAGEPDPGTSDAPIVTGPRGLGAERWLTDGWPIWRALAGMRAAIGIHTLRHTCASLLLTGDYAALCAALGVEASRRRWTLLEIRDLLGHSSITVTERYAHLAETAVHTAALETAPPAAAQGPRIRPLARVPKDANEPRPGLARVPALPPHVPGRDHEEHPAIDERVKGEGTKAGVAGGAPPAPTDREAPVRAHPPGVVDRLAKAAPRLGDGVGDARAMGGKLAAGGDGTAARDPALRAGVVRRRRDGRGRGGGGR